MNMFVIIMTIILIIGTCAIESAICMCLWNWVIVALFAVNPISFWFAVGIMLIINFAFAMFRNMSEFDT